MSKSRCQWCVGDPLYERYHDEEWGVPVHDDRKLFEMLTLEGAQAGLSWLTVLRKREGYRKAFDQFDPAVVQYYDQEKIDSLMQDPGIVRNQLKIKSTIQNAKAFLQVQEEYGTFADFIWSYVDDKPIINHWPTSGDNPAKTELSDRISKDLKKRGFKFVGSTIVYAFLQAAGMVMDHATSCDRYQELANNQV